MFIVHYYPPVRVHYCHLVPFIVLYESTFIFSCALRVQFPWTFLGFRLYYLHRLSWHWHKNTNFIFQNKQNRGVHLQLQCPVKCRVQVLWDPKCFYTLNRNYNSLVLGLFVVCICLFSQTALFFVFSFNHSLSWYKTSILQQLPQDLNSALNYI